MSRADTRRRKREAFRRGDARGGKAKSGATIAGGAIAGATIAGAKIAEDIALGALRLADRARNAGLSSVGHILETAALEASAEASARRWPSDGAASNAAASEAPSK